MTEILNKQNVSYHGKDYWLVRAKTYMENIILGVNLHMYYPKIMSLARGDQLALYSTNVTNIGEHHLFDAINITDRDIETQLPILPGRQINEMYAKHTMSRLGELGRRIKNNLAFWAITVLAGWIILGTCLPKIVENFCKCDCLECEMTKSSTCRNRKSSKTDQQESKSIEVEETSPRNSIITETDVDELLNRLSREYDSLMTPNRKKQTQV